MQRYLVHYTHWARRRDGSVGPIFFYGAAICSGTAVYQRSDALLSVHIAVQSTQCLNDAGLALCRVCDVMS